jgi:HD-GYP domain-containing protein (c-di-GMP phosphodiesterase class II)
VLGGTMPYTMDRATARVIPDDARAPGTLPDGLAIRYLDGSTTATPLTAALVRERRNDLRVLDREAIPTARLLAGLSMALDLTEGQLPGHALRTCFLAMHLADDLGIGTADRAALFYGAFLKDGGCSSNAAAISRIFGADDIEAKRRQSTIESSLLAYAAFTIRTIPNTEPLPRRLRRIIALGIRGQREHREIEQLRCERGAAIARKAGFDDDVAGAILDLHEHWDGGGDPRGLRGAEIHPLARILAACQGLDIFLTMQGRERAIAVMTQRVGTWYDPDIAEALLEACAAGRLEELAAPDLVGRTMALEPGSQIRTSDDADVDRVAQAFADIVDAKSPFTGMHSSRVADVAEGLAARLGLPAPEVVNVRRAGLLHDLGKLGVPNTVLDKPGHLDGSEMEVIRRHPELTLRILDTIPTFADVAELAACHHERLDGTGYFRGMTAPELALGARIVAVADVFEALTADRPYRTAMPVEAALAIMRESAGEHLAADVVEALADTLA